jgi:hypothetical protein
MTMHRVGALIAAFLIAAGCAHPPTESAAVRFHGEATDSVGDTAIVADARVARPPDLVYASVEVTDNTVRLTIRFAPGTLDPSSTGVAIDLDTDLDSLTGAQGIGVGSEYTVFMSAGPDREAEIARAVTDPGCTRPCRFEPFAHPALGLSSDAMAVVLPRASLAGFDGRLNFRVVAFARLNGGLLTITSDGLPNFPTKFIAVR